jgi:hypothetical protein
MKRAVVLVAIVSVVTGLAGCAPAPPADTVQGRCQQQVDNDPAVKAVLVQASSTGMSLPWQTALAQARHKSFTDCMVAAGVTRPGGVEPISGTRYPLGLY